AVYGYVFMEWLFFSTMPSFLGAMGRVERLGLLSIVPLPVVLVACTPLGALWGLAAFTRSPAVDAGARALGWAVPAAVLAACAFLLVDNFTYTLFGFGVASSTGLWRSAYAGLLALLFATVYRALRRGAHGALLDPRMRLLAAALVVVSVVHVAW